MGHTRTIPMQWNLQNILATIGVVVIIVIILRLAGVI